jgi:hypothetical protein
MPETSRPPLIGRRLVALGRSLEPGQVGGGRNPHPEVPQALQRHQYIRPGARRRCQLNGKPLFSAGGNEQ